jgi:hypothetical protein
MSSTAEIKKVNAMSARQDAGRIAKILEPCNQAQPRVCTVRARAVTDAFTEGCMETGRDLVQGGARYPVGPVLTGIGIADRVNSLAAIKRLVFDDQATDLPTLGVSKIPLRDALVQLKAEGLVTFMPERGAVVSELSANEVEEIYAMRIALESVAIGKAVLRLSTSDLVSSRSNASVVEHDPDLAQQCGPVSDRLPGSLARGRSIPEGALGDSAGLPGQKHRRCGNYSRKPPQEGVSTPGDVSYLIR